MTPATRRVPLVAATLLLLHCSGDDLELAGTVERRILELAAPVSEEILEVAVEIGDRVEAEQVLVQLDQEVAAAELRASEAAQAAAAASLEAAEREFARFEGLRRSRVATEQQFDTARRNRDEARSLLAEREARVAQAEKRLEDLTIRAHRDGIVDQLPFEAGERVPQGGVVAVVMATHRPWVRVWVPARAASRLRPGAEAVVRVEGLDGALAGRVVEIAHEPTYTPHYALTERESAHLVYETRVDLDDAPPDLRPGLPTRVILHLRDAAAP